jgi:IS5 family transposase
MREIRITQRSIFDPEYADHEIGKELAAISAWLDQHPEVLELVAADLIPEGQDSERGRSALPVEAVLRCGILKQYRQVSYRELEFLLKDSRSFAHFARLDPLNNLPCFTTLQSAISRIRAETWEALNQGLLASAPAKKVEKAQQIRFDATVVETHILSPADSRLLLDGVRVMVRLLTEARRYLGPERIVFHNHRRVAKRRHRAIESAKGAEQRAELYADLLMAVHKTVGYLDVARSVVNRCSDFWASGWVAEANHYRGLIERVIDQVQRRVFEGETVPANEKIVSLFEPHTDIIKKGGREVQYGHKVTLSTGKSGLVLDAVIEAGNPPDTSCLLPMLKRHIAQYGEAPVSLATDGGYAQQDNLDMAKELGVEHVAFHKKKGLTIEAMTGERWLYYKLKRFRAGIEAGISYLKRCFGLSRCNWKGLAHYQAYVWSSIFAHNLLILGRKRPAAT